MDAAPAASGWPQRTKSDIEVMVIVLLAGLTFGVSNTFQLFHGLEDLISSCNADVIEEIDFAVAFVSIALALLLTGIGARRM